MEQEKTNPFLCTRGNKEAPILVVGEAWGDFESRAKLPFVGPSGKELERMFFDAGILTSDCLFTNVVDAQPTNNDFTTFLEPYKTKGDSHNGLRISTRLRAGLIKLETLIDTMKPRLIVGAGNVPLWALTSHCRLGNSGPTKLPSGISSWRGSQLYTREINNVHYPYLPIMHPAAVLRAWDLRYLVTHDLHFRARRFIRGTSPWEAPAKANYVGLTFLHYLDHLDGWISQADHGPLELAVDIETLWAKHIACIGFASENRAVCIPFFTFNPRGDQVDYFTLNEEYYIVRKIQALLNHPNLRIIGQNYSYDYQFLRRMWQIKSKASFDTMLAHHTMYPGTPKSLDHLSSLYCESHVYWKDESQAWSTKLAHTDLWKYNCKDCHATYEIAQAQKIALTREKLTDQFKFQMEQCHLSLEMTDFGIAFNDSARIQIKAELNVLEATLHKQLLEVMPLNTRYSSTGVVWFKSPKQSMDIFYRQLGLNPVLHKKTKRPTLDTEALTALGKKAPAYRTLFKMLENYRSIGVFSSHFIDIDLSSDNRLHASFNVGGTETFRWSSSANAFDEATNLQNIPKGTEE